MDQHYLDHAATTPMLPVARDALLEHLGEVGNASSLHGPGRRARRVVEESRETIAEALGVRPGEVVFTSGGTESDNLAVKGLFWSRHAEDPRRRRILASAVEHHAVLDPLDWLAERSGAKVELIAVDDTGRVDLDALRAALERDPDSVALLTLMWANNEIGTLQPVAEAAALAAEHGIPVHTDAVQAVGSVPLDVGRSGVDALTFSGHKVGGPHGVGGLVVRRGVEPTPLAHGGRHERGLRSGTLDAPGIAATAAAVQHGVQHVEETSRTMEALRADLVAGILAAVPDAVVNGHPTQRLPGIAHLSFPGCAGDSLLMLLDAEAVACSTGSACAAGVPQPSHVLLALGREEDAARSSLRFSLGHTSTHEDVAAAVAAIGPAVERVRGVRGRRR